MKVQVNENNVNIDDGSIKISKESGAYFVRAEGFATIETDTQDTPPTPTVEYDPHYYTSGGNYMTVTDSAYRAMSRIDEMLFDAGKEELTPTETDLVFENVKSIIADKDTKGRHSVYTLTGGILKGMREGDYNGVPFAWLFKGVAEGYIVPDTPPPAASNAFGRFLTRVG